MGSDPSSGRHGDGLTRPAVHFTPPTGWLNDPNGLVHLDGVWHLCYQHHPGDLLWGPMHWGHATSSDLLTWEHHPVALEPDHLGAAFSGSAVVDHDGVAGFGRGALVAFYTHFLDGLPQSQGVARSTDGGTSWIPYDGNPVLVAPPGVIDFRDPKVFRLKGFRTEPWVMAVVAGDEVLFYRSGDLLGWRAAGRFGQGYGAHGGVWETPDLFELPVHGASMTRWVLTVSVQDGGPAGGSGTQYFLGDFDGERFTCEDPPEVVRWVDHGADFYAPQSWSDAPDHRRVWVAWMSNWAYARETPASTWRGAMTMPRDVSLHGARGRVALAQRPVPEVDRRGRVVAVEHGHELGVGEVWHPRARPAAADIHVSFEVGAGTGAFGLETHVGAGGATRITYLPGSGVLRVRRPPVTAGGSAPARDQEAALQPRDGVLDLRVLVDSCSVEVFADDGRVVLTNQVFPVSGSTGVAVFAAEAPVRVRSLTIRDLAG